MYHPSLLYYFNETGQADRNKTEIEREQRISTPLVRSLQEGQRGEKKTNTCKNQKKSQAAIVNTVATNPNTRQTRLPERDEPASHLAAK